LRALLLLALLWAGLPAQEAAVETEETIPEEGTFLVSCQHPIQSTRYEEAKNFSGLGTCCATVTGIILLYAFLGLIFDTWK